MIKKMEITIQLEEDKFIVKDAKSVSQGNWFNLKNTGDQNE